MLLIWEYDMHFTWFSRGYGVVFSHELTVAARVGFRDEWEQTYISWKTMQNAFPPMLRQNVTNNNT